jgi:hypothetical protein
VSKTASDGLFCPGQPDAGAFGQPGARCVQETGMPGGDLSDGLPHSTALGSVFCTPGTGNAAVDGVADLPGPGAIGLVGQAELQTGPPLFTAVMPAAEPDEPLVTGHGSILEARSDGTTASEARALCASPEACASANLKVLRSFMKKKYAALVKCARRGIASCDTSKADRIGPLPVRCRALVECLVDGSLELALGTNNPPTGPVTDRCAVATAQGGTKLVTRALANRVKGKPEKTAAAVAGLRRKLERKCPDPLNGTANLGGDCAGLTARGAALDCLLDGLGRATPLP